MYTLVTSLLLIYKLCTEGFEQNSIIASYESRVDAITKTILDIKIIEHAG